MTTDEERTTAPAPEQETVRSILNEVYSELEYVNSSDPSYHQKMPIEWIIQNKRGDCDEFSAYFCYLIRTRLGYDCEEVVYRTGPNSFHSAVLVNHKLKVDPSQGAYGKWPIKPYDQLERTEPIDVLLVEDYLEETGEIYDEIRFGESEFAWS